MNLVTAPWSFGVAIVLLTAGVLGWRSIDHKHWQNEPDGVPLLSVALTPAVPDNQCPSGMVHVRGNMKQDRSRRYGDSVEELQKTTCTVWLQRTYPERCSQFDQAAWEAIARTLPVKSMEFCIDKYEYPNIESQNPVIFVNWYEARDLCAAQGKRMCNEEEWTFACEGPEALPYPYGYTRDSTACNIDRQWRPFNEKNMYPRDSERAKQELTRLWQGVPSGAMPRCTSPFGVHDMTGNVDEWTVAVRPGPHKSVLKGGYWGPVRTRCRPATRSHDEGHYFYQQGMRCCADVRR